LLVALYELQDGKCAVTGIVMSHVRGNGRASENISIDRINTSIGYETGNIRLVCSAVNLMRNEMTDDELRLWAKRILNPI